MTTHLLVLTAALGLLNFLPTEVRVVGLKLEKGQRTCSIKWKDLPEGFVSNESVYQTGQSYRILNNIDNTVYIGGNETLVKLWVDANGVLKKVNQSDPFETKEPTGGLIRCADHSDADPKIVCWNFIRVVEKMKKNGSDDQLYVCGTNARSPRCYMCSLDLSNCPVISSPNKEVVPPLPQDNPLTAVFERDGGNVLYGGKASLPDPTFQRSNLADDGTATFELDTVTVGLNFIKEPTFVGKPFQYSDPSSGHQYVFLFYREPALEYSGQGNKIYSRVARACQNDTGGTVDTRKFVTYIKARLNCSLPDKLFPYHFNEIQDVIWREDTEEVYAVFTSPTLGPKASALCRYRMADIMKLMDGGEFKEQLSGNVIAQWLPEVVSDPRPGTCHEVHTTNYPPLLDKLVPNYNPLEPTPGNQPDPPDGLDISDTPTLHVDGVSFTSLAIDFDRCVYYLGTTDGTLIKAYKFNCTDPNEQFTTCEITDLGTEGTTVTGLELIRNGPAKHLVITTEGEVLAMSLGNIPQPTPGATPEATPGATPGASRGASRGPTPGRCSARCLEECKVKGPECIWKDAACKCFNTNPDECVEEQAQYIVKPKANTKVTSCDNKEVFLYCQVDYGQCSDRPVTLSWAKADNATFVSNNNHWIEQKRVSDKLLELKVTTHNMTIGLYNCTAVMDNGLTSVTKQVEIIMESCLTEDSLQRRCDRHEELKKKEPVVQDGTCDVEVNDCSSCRQGYSPLN